ncbi:hypothetical protein B0H34DRAFT_794172 [Crassisporium funariophilum]|nr:hypothetical protein B0H34DRAFT_794172 [Crassisporium funariophilum]
MPQSSPSRRLHNKENWETPRNLVWTPRRQNRGTPLASRQPTKLLFDTPLTVHSVFTPPPSTRKCRVAVSLSEEDVLRRMDEQKERRERERLAEERAQKDAKTARIDTAMKLIKDAGFSTFNSFLEDVLTAHDPSQSSHISKILINHGHHLFDLIQQRQPEITNDWVISSHRTLISKQCQALAAHFRPQQGSSVTSILAEFSVKGFLSEAKLVAPTICQVLRQVGSSETSPNAKYKDRDLILLTTLCMFAKSRNEHAMEFQTTMCMYFLACGTSCSMFSVLNHAGITLSYTQAIFKLKKLGQERLELTRKIAHTRKFMVIWDNLNIPFTVTEQRQNSKDHFDNGTTATLVPLYGVEFGGLPALLKPPRTLHAPILNFTAEDLLPSAEECLRVQAGQHWHIMDILYDTFPTLRMKLQASIDLPPSVMQIPVHKTEQYPLPAMHIDVSSLEGTLQVFDAIFRHSLQLTEDDLMQHGIVLCAGDQLSMSLLDKVSAIQRDDTAFMDNIGRYTEGQDGLLHLKFASARMVGNEFWGKPNSKSPWSLWRMNTLLGRKAISAGWAAKSPPPFRPRDTLEEWVTGIQSVEDVQRVAQWVHDELCSGQRVHQLRRESPAKCDIPLENICLFNRDSLLLRQLKYAIKQGDVGAVLDIITHLMLAFRGTGKTPKYADALFHIVVNLKRMDPVLRHAWLVNWLANLSGKEGGFKEMDLLQEHQNFWVKVIYNAKGSNRSWDWLAMVSVSIFALWDVIRKMQKEFGTPFNSTAHTSPATDDDIKTVCEYLKTHNIQSYVPTRHFNDKATEARDLLKAGAAYADRPSAFRNFTFTHFKTTNHGIQRESPEPGEDDEEDVDVDGDTQGDTLDVIDPGSELDADLDDLLLDDEEFPLGIMGDDFSMVSEIISGFRDSF